MPENNDDLRFEDWKKEQSKYELERKHQYSGSLISSAFRTPVLEAVKAAYAGVMDYLVSIPLEDTDKENIQKVRAFVKRMDDICDALYGDPNNERVQELWKKYGLRVEKVKVSSIRITNELHNLQNILRELRDIHMESGYFTTSAGLRLTIHRKRKRGMEALMDEEGFTEEEGVTQNA